MMTRCSLLLLFIFASTTARSQLCNSLSFNEMARIDLACEELALTMIHDNRDLPFLYIANKSEGFTIFDISDLGNPEFVGALSPEELDFLHVMNLT